MVSFKKKQKLVCVPCGREVIINNCGISRATIWCCGKPMAQKKGNKKPTKKR